jgi:hypothetical protein
LDHKRPQDEIVILYDENNGDARVLDFLLPYNKLPNVQTWRSYDFDRNFANWKNLLNSYCKGDFIYQLDADEMISSYMVENLHTILEMNDKVDLYFVPRINTVNGLTEEDVIKWGWNLSKIESQINEKIIDTESEEYKLLKNGGFIIEETDTMGKVKIKYYMPIINAYDYQGRIYRKNMTWYGKVHERIIGGEKFASLPDNEEYCIQHHKDIDRQRKQNDLYSKI